MNQIRFDKEEMPKNIFSDIAQKKAAEVVSTGGTKKNQPSQLRKFYDELVMWNEKVQYPKGDEARNKKYQELAPFIKMMNAKVAYAQGRDHVDETYRAMFEQCLHQVKNAETLRNCKLFMEAFMGFHKAEVKKQQDRKQQGR